MMINHEVNIVECSSCILICKLLGSASQHTSSVGPEGTEVMCFLFPLLTSNVLLNNLRFPSEPVSSIHRGFLRPTFSLCAVTVKERLYLSGSVCVCACLLEVYAQPRCRQDLGTVAPHLLGYWIQQPPTSGSL